MTSAEPAPLRHRRLHRAVFTAAGIYNLAWGTSVVVEPQWFFHLAGIAPLNHPDVFACLGMVIGLYGVLYLDVARRPEAGWLVAAVGLVGKVLGPLGIAMLIARGAWPLSSAVVCVANDFVWWLPFASYLRDAWPHFRRTL